MSHFCAKKGGVIYVLAALATLETFFCTSSIALAGDSHWVTGMAIGAATGAAVGGGVGYALAPACEENESKCRWQLPLLVGGTLMITGGAIGGLVGSMFGDRSFGVSPLVLPGPAGETAFGLNVRGRFD